MATTRPPETIEPFQDRIDTLFGELELAVKFDRPSILLAVYASEFVRADAEAALTARLRDLGQAVAHYRVTSEADADIPLHLAERSDRATAIYFVSGLQWGGGRDGAMAYRALNIRREYFVDYRIRAVFWLTEREAATLPRQAPDFWVFRHRVVEFVEAPARERMVPIAREAAWRDWEDRTLRENTDAKIEWRDALLKELPNGDETLAARADLLYTLAGLHWAKREYDKSIELWQQALAAAERLRNIGQQSRCYTGLGNVYRDLGRIDDAIAAYQRAIELDPMSAYPYNGLGNIYIDLGYPDSAIAVYSRAMELAPTLTGLLNNLGTVYGALGRTDDAIAAFRRALELDPTLAGLHNNLGNMYADLGRIDDAIAEYHYAIELAPRLVHPHYNLATMEAAQGNVEEALKHLEQAIRLDMRCKAYAWKSVDFASLSDDPRFRELVGE
jgi:tetratricopeptide (TPR) repeat protein